MPELSKCGTSAIIKVIGIGGGGGNAINTMIASGLTGVEFIAANTDVQALHNNLASIKIQLGRELTKGLGAGANPEIGRDAALEDKAIIQEVLSGADMVFITAGMGGGTGTGAAPIVAQLARELGALTVGVVTKPFSFEGKRRKNHSETGISLLRNSVDTLITIPNQRLLSIAPPTLSMIDGFKIADDVLLNAVKGISDIINIPGRVNVDFADVKTIMSEMGMALMGIGVATGPSRAMEAARSAINSPLLEDIDIEGATGILINITGSNSMTLHEISEASTLIQEAAHEDANIIFGAVIDEAMGDTIRVTVIATGFDQPEIHYPEQKIMHTFDKPMHNNQPQINPYANQGNYNSANQRQQPAYGSTANNNFTNGYRPQANIPTPFQQASKEPRRTNTIPPNNNYPQYGKQPEAAVSSNSNIAKESLVNNNLPKDINLQRERFNNESDELTHLTMEIAKSVELSMQQEDVRKKNNFQQVSEPGQDRQINGATINNGERPSDKAFLLADELANIEINDEQDYETPAFLRAKDESNRLRG